MFDPLPLPPECLHAQGFVVLDDSLVSDAFVKTGYTRTSSKCSLSMVRSVVSFGFR